MSPHRPIGGARAAVDALLGGPHRRQRRMMRRLEELDRLDQLAGPDEVLWPGGLSSRHDPRAWTPPEGPSLVEATR